MPEQTYTPLATVTLGTATTQVTMSNIPTSYRDLILVINGSLASAGSYWIRLNGDTGSNYSFVTAQANHGGGIASGSGTSTIFEPWQPNNLITNGRFVNLFNFMDYSATDKHKSFLSRIGGQQSDSQMVTMAAGRYASTSAINSIQTTATQNFNIGTTFSLYGVIA